MNYSKFFIVSFLIQFKWTVIFGDGTHGDIFAVAFQMTERRQSYFAGNGLEKVLDSQEKDEMEYAKNRN